MILDFMVTLAHGKLKYTVEELLSSDPMDIAHLIDRVAFIKESELKAQESSNT